MKVLEMEHRTLLLKPEAVSEALDALCRAFGQRAVDGVEPAWSERSRPGTAIETTTTHPGQRPS